MKLIAKISLLAILVISTAVNAYELIGWRWQYNNIVFHTGFNSGEDGTSAADYQSALNDAINSWNSESNFQYDINSAYIDPCAAGGDNSASFESDICGAAFGDNALAVASTFYSNGGGTIYSDIFFNSSYNWGIHNNSGPPYDFKRVALHEVGHTLGIGHEENNSSIMNPGYQGNVTTLQQDDINGIRAIYGFGSTKDYYADDTSTATVINFATDVSGSIEVGDDDYFSISVPAGGGDLDIYSTGPTDTYGYLLDSSGGVIAENNYSGTDSNFKITRTLSTGTYYIRVRGNYFATTGTYTVRANIAIQTPAAPIATVQSTNQINLLWTSANSATYYRLYNGNNQIYAGTDLSYNNTGLISNTTYNYTLQACINSNIDTCSVQSAASSATTQEIILRTFVIEDNSGVIRGTIIADGINCGANGDDCSQTHAQNTQVQLAANANSNYSFSGWSSDCSGTDNPLTIIMDSSKLCSASFAFVAGTEPNQFTFTSQADVAINTTITSNLVIISGINTASNISIINGEYSINNGAFSSNNGTINNGNAVSVRHISSSNYSSSKFSTLIIGGISANFVSTTQAIPTYTLTTSATNGNISANGISCGTDCTETYNKNTQVQLTASVNSGYDFSSWSGDCSGTDNPLTINMDSNKSCSANFIISAPNIAFSPATVTAVVGTYIDISATNTGGVVASYSIAPAIANNLSFNTNTGTISGTPSATASATTYTITATNVGGTDSATLSITVNPAAITFSLDIDGNQTINASNDGLIIFKYLLNSNANNLHTTISSNAMEGRRTTPELKAYLDNAGTILDADGNQTINASNDGLIIFKYLLNSNANNLHTTISSNAMDGRKTTPQLKVYLDKFR